jgi:nickel-dependent lactate racemase
MIVELAYGQGRLPIELPDGLTTVVSPRHTAALPDERAALWQALDQPVDALPLRAWVKPDSRICITFTDITRATPNERLIPWLLEYLGQPDPERVTLLNSLGTHRPNTPAELERMLGRATVSRYRVVDNEPHNPEAHVQVGTLRDGTPALVSRHFMAAEVRIVTGFIEPHFFAGFSGGPKGIMPGISCLPTVMSNHGAHNIRHPQASFGATVGNPLWEEMRGVARAAGPCFLVNVTLNQERRITGVFAGDLEAAHRLGTEFVRETAMHPVPELYDVVITTNSGYPLDQNLYQGVKGMAAAARIVKPGGTIILACEAREGTPPGSPYDRLLRSVTTPEEIIQRVATPGFCVSEQWQAQIQAHIQQKARVLVHSSMADADIRAALMEPCADIAGEVRRLLAQAGPQARVAVLPEGPLSIPYLATA